MASEMEKDVLIEYIGSIIAKYVLEDINASKLEELKDLEDKILSTSYLNLDYNDLVLKLKEYEV